MITEYSAEYVQDLRNQITQLQAALDEQSITLEDLQVRHHALIDSAQMLTIENKNLRAWQQAAINEAHQHDVHSHKGHHAHG